MSESLPGLRRQLGAAGELKSVVRAMKALAASSLGQYERSVTSLRDYAQTIELGVRACTGRFSEPVESSASLNQGASMVIFGSDQGLVGQFNESLANLLRERVPPGAQAHLWVVGERMTTALQERGFMDIEPFDLPHSIEAIAPMIGRLLVSIQSFQEKTGIRNLAVAHQQPKQPAFYEPIIQQLLPGGAPRSQSTAWPTKQVPQIIGRKEETRDALLRERIFVSLFRACAESLASENASRLAGMQRAEKNIEELSGDLTRRFHRLRQSAIDEELFDVVAGFEALNRRRQKAR